MTERIHHAFVIAVNGRARKDIQALVGRTKVEFAAPADHQEPTTTTSMHVVAAEALLPDVSAAVNGSKRDGTPDWGKIRYQACFSLLKIRTTASRYSTKRD